MCPSFDFRLLFIEIDKLNNKHIINKVVTFAALRFPYILCFQAYYCV